MTTTDKAISDQVLSITNDLEQGITITQQDIDEGRYDEGQYEAGDILSAWDYLNDALDIEYTVNGAKEYRGASILVAFGGPNITINTSYGCYVRSNTCNCNNFCTVSQCC